MRARICLAAVVLGLAPLGACHAQVPGASAGASASANASASVGAPAPVVPAQVIRRLPHDRGAYTEGLFVEGTTLFESTGMEGRSAIREEDLATGRVRAEARLAPALFGEGIAPWQGQILYLTWRDGVGFRWRRDGLAAQGQFAYLGEGWGMAAVPAGALVAGAAAPAGGGLVMSDGSASLKLIAPDSFRLIATLAVTDQGQPVERLNELEWVEGEIYANVWQTDRIARIDPATGHVLGWIDVAALHAEAGVHGIDQVPNGIAYDAAGRHLYVTGKEWPVLFEIALPQRRAG